MELSSAPELEPDWREDILELRNATNQSFKFATVFEDQFPERVESATRAEQERAPLSHCGSALRSRVRAPGYPHGTVKRPICSPTVNSDLGCTRVFGTVVTWRGDRHPPIC